MNGYEAHSAEAVRDRIREMIEKEEARDVLSDDRIVGALLTADGIDIARRTVAKYREAMRIPSSVERRKNKLSDPYWPLISRLTARRSGHMFRRLFRGALYQMNAAPQKPLQKKKAIPMS